MSTISAANFSNLAIVSFLLLVTLRLSVPLLPQCSPILVSLDLHEMTSNRLLMLFLLQSP